MEGKEKEREYTQHLGDGGSWSLLLVMFCLVLAFTKFLQIKIKKIQNGNKEGEVEPLNKLSSILQHPTRLLQDFKYGKFHIPHVSVHIPEHPGPLSSSVLCGKQEGLRSHISQVAFRGVSESSQDPAQV